MVILTGTRRTNKESTHRVVANVTNKAQTGSNTPLDLVDNQDLGSYIATTLIKMLKPSAGSVVLNTALID